MSLFAMLIFVSGGALKSCAAKEDFVAVDLRYGIVTGYSPYISFVRTPTAPASSRSDVRAGQSCSSQAVLRVTMSDPNKGMTLMLDYGHSPRLWTLDISDSLIHDDSNFSTTDQAAEAHIHNRQLRVYASGFHGYPDAAVGGRHLVHVTDDVVKKGSRLQLDVSTERLEVATPRGAVLHEMESPFLFNVSAQRALQTGSWEYELFVGLNRVVSSAHRSGSGLCKVEISLYEFGTNVPHSLITAPPPHTCFLLTWRVGRPSLRLAGQTPAARYRWCERAPGACHLLCPSLPVTPSVPIRGLRGPGVMSPSRMPDPPLSSPRPPAPSSPATLKQRCCQQHHQRRLHNSSATLRHLLLVVLVAAVVCSLPLAGAVGAKTDRAGRSAKDCERGTHTCHRDAECGTSRKTYKCKCKDGFYGDGKICVDDDECKFENGGCAHACHNSPGNFSCSCYAGFVLANDGLDCIDLNECLDNRGGCSQQCVNTMGSFLCRCDAGYSLHEDGRTCVSGTWCRSKLGCDHHCTSTSSRNPQCACRPGYQLAPDGKKCTQTCSVGNGGCQHVCKDGPTGTQCSCAPKYILASDKVSCIASCAVKNGGCEKKCRDTPSGPVCSCPAGYQLHQDGRSCLDIDECQKDNGGCSHQCVNNHGSYECVCPAGHKVGSDQNTCTDIDECAVKEACDHVCTNVPGSYRCTCRPGFQLYGVTHCADVDECSVQNGGCQHNCSNTDGSYKCSCAPGYKLHPNARDCVEADQCLTLREPAMSILQCSPPDPRRRQQRCTLRCQAKARFTSLSGNEVALTCSAVTNYQWKVEGVNTSIPACSEKETAISYKRKARLAFIVKRCEVKDASVEELKASLAATLEGQKKYRCEKSCQVNYVNITCGTQVNKLKRLVRGTPDELVTAEVEIQMNSQQPTGKCGASCMAARTLKLFKRSFRKLKKGIGQNKFEIKFEARHYKVLRKSFAPDKKVEEACEAGFILVNKTCVACSAGTFYDSATGACSPCPAGTYQNKEGKLRCKSCEGDAVTGPPGASSRKQCADLCAPGYYSANGSVPCAPCPAGTFQPQAGRTTCLGCGPQLTTTRLAASSFAHCRAQDNCSRGHFYNATDGACRPCPVGTYQPESEQNFCIACPGTTTTDNMASTGPEDCKDRTCGKFEGEYFGILQSPNYPGNYPNNVNCVWTIKPEKNRRILIIVPDIALRDDDKCGDVLVMRKSKSPYSRTTFETCVSRTTPIAFTARSSKLWIQFKSDGNNTAGGFSIPFVTYNEEYQSLIEDIVKDGRLYSSYQHQQIFKDRMLLHALLEVIATPYNYLKYANVSRSMFPHSFFKLLTPKVRRFFYS